MEPRHSLNVGGHSEMFATLFAAGGRVAQADRSFSLTRKRVTTNDGVSLSLIDVGDTSKQPIVFVHGVSQSALSWRAQLSSAALLTKYRLIALDLRGHGQSQGALGAMDDRGVPLPVLADNKYAIPNDDAASSALWASDVAAVITGLALTSPVLVGWSYGATVVADYMRVNQGLGAAHKVLFTGGSPVALAPGTSDGGADTVLSAATFGALLKTLDFNPSTGAPSTYQDVIAGISEFVELALSDTVGGRAPATRDEILEHAAFNLALPPLARQTMASRASDFRPFLRGLSASTKSRVKIINGGADAVNQTSNAKKYYESCGLTVTTFAGEGHALFARNPTLFNTELDNHISAT